MLHIDAEVFDRLGDGGDIGLVSKVVDAAKDSLLGRNWWDVFISYNQRDFGLASQMKSGLEDAGLRVFMDVPKSGMRFTPTLKDALLTSLTFVPIITGHVGSSRLGEERGWVEREVSFRRTAFDGSSNIFPVRTEGGDVGIVADVTPIDAAGRGDSAVVAALVEAVRSGPGKGALRDATPGSSLEFDSD